MTSLAQFYATSHMCSFPLQHLAGQVLKAPGDSAHGGLHCPGCSAQGADAQIFSMTGPHLQLSTFRTYSCLVQ